MNDSWNNSSIAYVAWFLIMGKEESPPSINSNQGLKEHHEAYLKGYLDVVKLLIVATFQKTGAQAKRRERLLTLDPKSILRALEEGDPKGELLRNLHHNARVWLGLEAEKPKGRSLRESLVLGSMQLTVRAKSLAALAKKARKYGIVSPELEQERANLFFFEERSRIVDRIKAEPSKAIEIIKQCAKKLWNKINDLLANDETPNRKFTFLCNPGNGHLMSVKSFERRLIDARYYTLD